MYVIKVFKGDKLTHTASFETINKAEYWIEECTKLNLFNRDTHKVDIKEVGVELSTIKFRELETKVNEILKETDWSQLSDTLLDKPRLKTKYREYRSYIRKEKKQYNNDTVLNFKLLSFEEWLKMKSYFKYHDYEG